MPTRRCNAHVFFSQDLIQRRKAEFSKTEREIEARLREEEEKEKERERRLRGETSDGGGSGGEERQVEHNQTDNRHFAADGKYKRHLVHITMGR